MDEQVKVRGYRIEPGEVESVALESGLLEQVVVVASGDGGYLVGYGVAAGGLDREGLLEWLSERLPEYMVPRVWVELEQAAADGEREGGPEGVAGAGGGGEVGSGGAQ